MDELFVFDAPGLISDGHGDMRDYRAWGLGGHSSEGWLKDGGLWKDRSVDQK
jgi:hypothetical protein